MRPLHGKLNEWGCFHDGSCAGARALGLAGARVLCESPATRGTSAAAQYSSASQAFVALLVLDRAAARQTDAVDWVGLRRAVSGSSQKVIESRRCNVSRLGWVAVISSLTTALVRPSDIILIVTPCHTQLNAKVSILLAPLSLVGATQSPPAYTHLRLTQRPALVPAGRAALTHHSKRSIELATPVRGQIG